jgi:hypothetical protein
MCQKQYLYEETQVMQHTIQLDVVSCLSEDGFSLDELVIKTRELFEREGMAGMIGLLLRLADERICRGLVGRQGSWHPKLCCDHPRYDYKDSLDRTFRTSAGTVRISWHRLRCVICKTPVVPLRTFLGLERYQRKTSELEKMVDEVMSEQSYRRGSDHLERIGEIPVPKSTAHRWVMESDCDEVSSSGQPFDYLLADGTGFKRRFVSGTGQTNQGELRVLLGITATGTTVPVGTWSGKNWSQIGDELKGQPQEKWPTADVLGSDGEPGLAEGLSAFFNDQQRCHWHAARDLNHILWKDKATLEERKAFQEDLALTLGLEIPPEDIEPVTPSDRKDLAQYVADAEDHIETMIGRMNKKGYAQAAGYLRRMKDHLFTYMKRWLATGLVGPRVSSWIERVMREVARRIKRMAFGWSEKGAEKMTRIVLKRFTDREGWEAWWNDRLRLNDNVLLTFRGAKAQ